MPKRVDINITFATVARASLFAVSAVPTPLTSYRGARRCLRVFFYVLLDDAEPIAGEGLLGAAAG